MNEYVEVGVIGTQMSFLANHYYHDSDMTPKETGWKPTGNVKSPFLFKDLPVGTVLYAVLPKSEGL